MNTVIAYRIEILEAPEGAELGERWSLDPPEYDPAQYRVRSHTVTLALAPRIRLGSSAVGRTMLYREFEAYGQTVAGALTLGWCRILEPESEGEAVEAGGGERGAKH